MTMLGLGLWLLPPAAEHNLITITNLEPRATCTANYVSPIIVCVNRAKHICGSKHPRGFKADATVKTSRLKQSYKTTLLL